MEKAIVEKNIKLEEWVISMLEKENPDIRLIAREGGFGDHKNLGRYMLKRGYVWSGEIGNYAKVNDQIITEREELYDKVMEIERGLGNPKECQAPNMEFLSKYLPVLDILQLNQERLIELLGQSSEQKNTICPKMQGNCIPSWMNELVLEFCNEHKLSRQQVYEAAIYEFLYRYRRDRVRTYAKRIF